MADRAQINAVIKGDAKDFNKSIDSASNKAKTFVTGALKQMGGAIVAAFAVQRVIQFGKELLRVADDIQTTANTFGIAVESVLAFKGVMAESGIGVEKFMKMFGRMVSAQADARKGLTTYVDALRDMNISARDFSSLKVDKLMELMAKKYQEAGDKMLFLGGAAKLLGTKIGPNLIEVFQRINEEGMAGFTEEAKKAADGVKELAATSDALEGFFDTIQTRSLSAAGAMISLGKEFQAMAKWYQGGIGPLGEMRAGRKETFKSIGLGRFEEDTTDEERADFDEVAKLVNKQVDEITGGGLKGYLYKVMHPQLMQVLSDYATTLIHKRKLREDDEAKEKQAAQDKLKADRLLANSPMPSESKEFLKWYDLYEKRLLGQKDILSQIAYYEEEINSLHKDQVEDPSNYNIAIDILKLEKKRYDLVVKINKEQEKGLKDYFKDEEAFAKRLGKAKKEEEKKIEEAPRERFNELARIGGQVGGQGNFAAGNAIKAINVAEKQARIAESSDKKLTEIRVAVDKLNNKPEEGAVLQ